ncbi:hypothetical protein Tco_1063770 [Tanacetum coccineum]
MGRPRRALPNGTTPGTELPAAAEMAQGVTLDTGESYPRLAYFPSFLGGGEVHRKCEEAVLTVSTSAFERYTSRLTARFLRPRPRDKKSDDIVLINVRCSFEWYCSHGEGKSLGGAVAEDV